MSEPRNKTDENSFNVSLNKDQLEQLLAPSTTTISPPSGTISSQNALNTSFLAQKGTFRTTLNSITKKLDPWIIDSSALNHMTRYTGLFSTYNPGLGHIKVKIANSSLATVAWIGTIVLNPRITLYDVLHVPQLACNLLSISKLKRS